MHRNGGRTMKKYRVLVKVTAVHALEIDATDATQARKVAELKNYYTGDYLGILPIQYEVVDNEFDTTN